MNSIAAVIVTFNRKDLLIDCLTSLLNQTKLPDQIFIIDNASTDGTQSALQALGFLNNSLIKYHFLPENTGGAGGFVHGMRLALEQGMEWVWMMDDDALAESDALENLFKTPLNKQCVYGSVVTGHNDSQLCWPVDSMSDKRINAIEHLTDQHTAVYFHPFLGFLINRQLVEKVGFPDESFFISGDDFDYCLNIRGHGGTVFLCSDSRLKHPVPPRKVINVLGYHFTMLVQAPGRSYYNIRNKIVIARRYYGIRLWTHTLPSIIFRLLVCLCSDSDKWGQARAYYFAIFHGLTNRLGRYSL